MVTAGSRPGDAHAADRGVRQVEEVLAGTELLVLGRRAELQEQQAAASQRHAREQPEVGPGRLVQAAEEVTRVEVGLGADSSAPVTRTLRGSLRISSRASTGSCRRRAVRASRLRAAREKS
jgi:hypothetical protein